MTRHSEVAWVLAAGLITLNGCNDAIAPETASTPSKAQEAMMAHFAAEARRITDTAVAETSSGDAWSAARDRRFAELREMLGLGSHLSRTPLNPQITGRIQRVGYVVEKIAFESIPSVYVTANLYLPTESEGPVPAIIYVCGHAYSPHGAKTSYQRHGHTLAKHGYAALVIDPLQIAETAALHHGVFNQEMYEWYTRAYSPAGLEVWNVIRALDYLETRPEVDRQRFAITGRSGGAAMSWFSAAVEPRIKAAIPIMGIATYAAAVANDTQRLHCDCMFPVNFRMQDLIHLGALISPRPLLTAHGRTDRLFPVAGYEEFSSAMGALYTSQGSPDRFRNLEVDSGHEDSDLLRAEAVKWLDRWLLEREPREIDTTFDPIEPADLSVFGGSPPADARNHVAHDFFIPDTDPTRWDGTASWEAKRSEVLEALRSQVFAAIPASIPVPETYPGSLEPAQGYEPLAFRYPADVPVETVLRIPESPDGPALLHVAAPGEGPVAAAQLLRNIRRFGSNPVMVVFPPGSGLGTWPKSTWKSLLRNAMHAGRTVDTVRIAAVLAAAQVLRDRAGDRPVAISGVGPAAGWALYAAVLDSDISHAILARAPASHLEGPVVLGAMRHADFPGIAALLAPRRLTFYGRMPETFEVTQEVYEGLGVGERLTVSMSIGAALNGMFGHGFSLGL